jgi:predicted amidohydrolase
MKISVVSYSLSDQPASLDAWSARLTSEIQSFMADGSKIILYPELFLMGIADYLPEVNVAAYIKDTLLPKLALVLKGQDVLVCLGSGPRIEENNTYNSSSIWLNDTWTFQDKIHLTPWETSFTPGNAVRFFEFHKLRVACLICYDVEQPGLALMLKRNEIHLLLVPSATMNKNGNQRINRCASARSVELGALVITTPLVGDSKCDLVDHSEGRQGFFLPAQEIVTVEQEIFSAYSSKEQVVSHFEVETEMLKKLKIKDQETKPYFKEDVILP